MKILFFCLNPKDNARGAGQKKNRKTLKRGRVDAIQMVP